MEILPFIIAVIIFLFFARIKIPKGLKPVPALEIEFPTNYEAVISLNQKELIHLPIEQRMIDNFQADKGRISRSAALLKYRRQGSSSIEVLLNLYDTIALTEDCFDIHIAYKKTSQGQFAQGAVEIDYALAYIHNGKLIHDSDIREHNFRLTEDVGTISLRFENLAQKARERMDRLS